MAKRDTLRIVMLTEDGDELLSVEGDSRLLQMLRDAPVIDNNGDVWEGPHELRVVTGRPTFELRVS